MTLEEAVYSSQKAYDDLCSIPDEELNKDQVELVDNVANIQKALVTKLQAAMELT